MAVVFLPTCLLINGRAVEAPRTNVAPACRIDLKSVVKEAFLFEPWGSPEGRSGPPVRSIWFLDNQRLAVTVVTQAGGKPELATRGGPNASSPFRLNAVLIDATSGKILDTPGWPSNSRFAGIIAANGKGFVTQRGEELTLLSFDLAPIKQVTLPPLPRNYLTGYWSPHTSWSGRHLLFFAGPAWVKIPWLWVDAESLQVLESWQDVVTGTVTASDDQVVSEPYSRRFGDPPSTLKAEVPGGNWKPIPLTLSASVPRFVGPDLLYFHRYIRGTAPPRAEAFLVRIDGSEIFRLETTHKGWVPGQASVSRVGNRFVILVGKTEGSHPALDIGGYSVLKGLLVYDPPFRAPASTLLVRDSKVRDPSAALSPDGRHLAVLGYPQPLLEIFDLPPTN